MRGHRLVVIAVLGLCGWCGWVSGYHRTTAAAEVTWLVTIGGVVLVDVVLRRGRTGGAAAWRVEPVREPWPRPGRGGAAPAVRGVAPWLALLLVIVAWEVLGIDTGQRQYHLTVSALAQAYRPLNAALLLVWALVGIGYEVARVRAPAPGDETRADSGGPEATGGEGGALAAATGALGNHHVGPALLLPASPPVGVAFWVAVPLAAVVIDALARRSDGRLAKAEEFVRFISTARAANLALIATWAFAGYHLFAR